MNSRWRYVKILLLFAVLFSVTTLGPALLLGWNLDRLLTEQYEFKGKAIATGIAGASPELLLFRDAATIQAVVDQYLMEGKIQGIAYIFVVDKRGNMISHTFSPRIPEEVYGLGGDQWEITFQQLRLPGRGDYIDVSAPILMGRLGHVHVGMDRELIRSAIRSALLQQTILLGLLFPLSVLTAYVLLQTDQPRRE
jgi:hypothetical protein